MENFIICNWFTYTNVPKTGIIDKRCTLKCSDKSMYCEKHSVIIKDFKILNSKKTCKSNKIIHIVPRSYDQILLDLKQLGYDICARHLCIEPYETYADLSNENYILLDNDTKYYYNSDKKTQNTECITLELKKYCTNPAMVISNNNNILCRDCYEQKVSYKIGGPTINTIINYETLKIELQNLIDNGQYIKKKNIRKKKNESKENGEENEEKGENEEDEEPLTFCTQLLKNKDKSPCTRVEYKNGFCKLHYTLSLSKQSS